MNDRDRKQAPCPEWRREAQRLLIAAADDPARAGWIEHARACPLCRALIEADNRLEILLGASPDPEPAFIYARVMGRVNASPRKIPFGRRDFGWGLATAAVGLMTGLIFASVKPEPVAADLSGDQSLFAGAVTDEFDEFALLLGNGEGESR